MSKEKIYFRVAKGSLIPADSYAITRLKARNYRLGDVVSVVISKPRNGAFNRLIHKLGQIVAANIEEFEGLDAHQCIKRLQIEANAGCDEVMANIPGVGKCLCRIPRSLSYESMDEIEYQAVAKKICHHIANVYWTKSTPEQIERMAIEYQEAA